MDLTDRFETNMAGNSTRKRVKYTPLMNRLKSSYINVVYCYVSMGACGFIEKDSKRFFELLSDLNVSDTEIKISNKKDDKHLYSRILLHFLLLKQGMDKSRTLRVLGSRFLTFYITCVRMSLLPPCWRVNAIDSVF